MKELKIEFERPDEYKGRLPFIKGKGRPRPINGSRGGVFSPKTNFEKIVLEKMTQFREENGLGDPEIWRRNSAYFVEIVCFFELPKSFTKKEIEEKSGSFYTGKPDADNIEKIIFDCLEKSKIIENDKLIAINTTKRFYHCFVFEKEKIIIKVKDLF